MTVFLLHKQFSSIVFIPSLPVIYIGLRAVLHTSSPLSSTSLACLSHFIAILSLFTIFCHALVANTENASSPIILTVLVPCVVYRNIFTQRVNLAKSEICLT